MVNIINIIEDGVVTIDTNIQDLTSSTEKEIFGILSLELVQIRNFLVEKAKEYIGAGAKKYSSPDKGMIEGEFDCSGFITFILKHFGLSKPGVRHSNEYFDSYGIFVHQPIAGDLVFFSNNGKHPSHIGIYIGGNQYIHKDGNKIQVADMSFKTIQGVDEKSLYTTNPIGFKRISLKISNFQGKRWDTVI